jgi:hypothetical protein
MDGENAPDIVLVERRLDPAELARLVSLHFEDERVREITFTLIGEGEPLP